MELVEGQTLADRLALGALSLAEALPIARQIAEALEAAHQRHVVHRDLKPANVKIRDDGSVKVLDFGLATVLDIEHGVANERPARTGLTEAGTILGTAAYMSPEQARGKPTGPHADIWAFGCVLFEMVAGVRAFSGDGLADTISAVVSQDPDWTALPPTASSLRPLIARCVRKDVRQRLQAIGDARIQLEELSESAPSTDVTRPLSSSVAGLPLRQWPPAAFVAIAAAAVVAATAAWMARRPAPPTPAVVSRFKVVPPPAAGVISGDGSGILGTELLPASAGDIVWFPLKPRMSGSVTGSVFEANRPSAEPIIRTPAIEYNPVLSPDGRYIAYESNASGSSEIYVRPFPRVDDGRWQVSTQGGTRPVWPRTGREIFYLDLRNRLTPTRGLSTTLGRTTSPPTAAVF